MRRLRVVLIVILFLLVLGAGGFVLWANAAAAPMPEALAALQSDAAVRVTAESNLTFAPADQTPTVGFIFYPGGRVDPRAYAPLARQIASAGYLTVIVPMPLNLAFFNITGADAVINAYPNIQHWAVGGHSLGGAMAAQYLCGNPGKAQGLVLLAAYPACDLSGADLAVTSIYATLDGLASVEQVEGSAAQLPATATFVKIEGGNHAGFGYYGDQAGDNPAAISRADQHAQAAAAIVALLAILNSGLAS